jgi:D-xylose transport system ATP-binding protein
MTANGATALLSVRNARKRFGAVTALAGVNLDLHRGEILALLGDNGAGKTTLIKALSGVHQLDAGEIAIDGERVDFRTPHDARGAGIDTVYQDLALFGNLTPAANFFIGRELRRPRWLGPLGLLREKEMTERWREQLDRLQVRIKDLDKPLGLMSGGQRQAVAVARAVTFARRVVILDEPTAALGLRESAEVLQLVRRLPEQGISVILVSHNLDHVMQVADRAVVLRQGRQVGEAIPTAEHHQYLVGLIVGASGGDVAAGAELPGSQDQEE